MSEAETYDTRVQAIRAYNRPLLEDFGTWLDHKGFSEQTVITHWATSTCLLATSCITSP